METKETNTKPTMQSKTKARPVIDTDNPINVFFSKPDKIFTLSKVEDICRLLDPRGNLLSRPVRTGKSSLLTIFKLLFKKNKGFWKRILKEIQELITQFEKLIETNKTHGTPNIRSRLKKLTDGQETMNEIKDNTFLVFHLDFSKIDTTIDGISVDKYNVRKINDVLCSTKKMDPMYKFFNNLEKSEMDKESIADFRMELNKIIEINTLHEKIEELDTFLTYVAEYCEQIDIDDEEIEKIVPKMVILVDEFHCIETLLQREIDTRESFNYKKRIISRIADISTAPTESTNNIQTNNSINIRDGGVRILDDYSLQKLKKLIKITRDQFGQFMKSLKDRNRLKFYLIVGTNSFQGYIETIKNNSASIRTFDNRLGNCCGITREEIKKYLHKHLESFANEFNFIEKSDIEEKEEMIYPEKFRCFLTNSQTEYIMKFINNEKIMDPIDVLDIMQIYYNNINYTFTGKFTTFNIFSVCRTFQHLRIDAYWITKTEDVFLNITESDLHDYFIHKYKADEITAKMNRIDVTTLERYRQDKARTTPYITRLIKLYYLGVMSIQEYVEEEIIENSTKDMSPIKKKTGRKWFYLAPSCVEARHALYSTLVDSIQDKSITDIDSLEKALLSFLSFSLLQRLKDTFYETLKDKELLNESQFSEDLYSARFREHFSDNVNEHSEVINVEKQKPGRPEDKDKDLKMDMFMEIRDFVLRDTIKGVAIFEFKKNDPSKNADTALACIFLRRYYAFKHYKDVENVACVGINVRTNYDPDNKPKIEKVLGMDIRLLRILNKDIYTKIGNAHRNKTTDYLKNKAIVEFINSGQYSEMYKNETMTINSEAKSDSSDVGLNEQREASDAE